jgi:8-oxo-dGTP pyrophosphatase MutT (NUDIX family)
MRINSSERQIVLRKVKRYSALGGAEVVDRVRCVLCREGSYLLVQHDARRPENRGKWALPGGRLKGREAPRVGLRREIAEELRLRLPYLIELGDWWHRDENHRIFGCDLSRDVEWFNKDEIRAVAWLAYEEVQQLAAAGRLRIGFELAAIAEYRRKRLD